MVCATTPTKSLFHKAGTHSSVRAYIQVYTHTHLCECLCLCECFYVDIFQTWRQLPGGNGGVVMLLVVVAVIAMAVIVVAVVVISGDKAGSWSGQSFNICPFSAQKEVADRPTDRQTDGPTDGQTDGPTDKPSYRDAWTHLKREQQGRSATNRCELSVYTRLCACVHCAHLHIV